MLFDDKTKIQLSEARNFARVRAQQVPFKVLVSLFSALAISMTLFLEGHILLKLFENLSGEGNDYWSPEYMSISAGVVAIGFHIMAREHENSFAIRFVKKGSQVLIPIYLMGVGLVIAGMMVGDGIGSIIGGDTIDLNNFDLEPQENEFEQMFAQISHPMATFAFSIGIGGFAIINIFVVHELMLRIEQGLTESIAATKTFHAVKKDYAFAMSCHEAYLENEFDIGDLELQADDQFIAEQQAANALSTIHRALAPHEEFLKEQQLYQSNKPTLFDTANSEIDAKQLEKFVTRIRTLDLANIKKTMVSK